MASLSQVMPCASRPYILIHSLCPGFLRSSPFSCLTHSKSKLA